MADGLVGEGAEAAVLVGSHARGDAGPNSDVDVLAVGPQAFSFRLEHRGGLLVSVSSRPPEAYRREMADPGCVGTAVPGWREAVVLHDPNGTAGALIEEAEAWTWGPLERRCDGWVAEEITSLAEEVHKLVAATRTGDRVRAAVQRSVLALRPSQVLAVHRRILYGSENRLWDLVAEAMGEGWHQAQFAALGLNGEPFEETCRAALGVYGLAADEAQSLLDERQRRVVRHAQVLSGLAEG
ncbi:MAG: nucleotidyltransferase domain-containing protein [Actinomycetota bacterium]|nr:nucleotidyltransferase domain-containing protein [Actinomycetota bacterium]